jgi:hypothetical protein
MAEYKNRQPRSKEERDAHNFLLSLLTEYEELEAEKEAYKDFEIAGFIPRSRIARFRRGSDFGSKEYIERNMKGLKKAILEAESILFDE